MEAAESVADEPLLEWRRHPAGEEPRTAALLVIGMGLALAALHAVFRAPVLTALGTLLLFGSLADFLLPSRYRLTREGVERRGQVGSRQLPWDRVAVAYDLEDGVLVTPRSRKGWLDSYHGIYLPYEGHREAVVAIIAERAVARRLPEAADAS